MKTLSFLLVTAFVSSAAFAGTIRCAGFIGVINQAGEVEFATKTFEQQLTEEKKIMRIAFKSGEVVASENMTDELYARMDEDTLVLTLRLTSGKIHSSVSKAKFEKDELFAYNKSSDTKGSNLIAYNHYLTCNGK